MKKYATTIIRFIKIIPCMFGRHDYTSSMVGTSTEYRGKFIPRLILFTCKRCGHLTLDEEIVPNDEYDPNSLQ